MKLARLTKATCSSAVLPHAGFVANMVAKARVHAAIERAVVAGGREDWRRRRRRLIAAAARVDILEADVFSEMSGDRALGDQIGLLLTCPPPLGLDTRRLNKRQAFDNRWGSRRRSPHRRLPR